MSIDQFLNCLETGNVSERALAVRKTARCFLSQSYEGDLHCAFEAALTLVLDDTSPRVRAALAETLSLSANAPEHLVASLAIDQPEVAAPILARSTLVRDIDLIDRIKMVDDNTQTLIANRVHVSESLAAAIAENGCVLACMTLISNETAKIAPVTFARISDRFSDDATMRGILASDPRVPAVTRHSVVIAASQTLQNAPLIKNILGDIRAQAVSDEAAKQAVISLVETCELEEYPSLIEHLRQTGQLTSSFIIRVLACGKVDFFGDILVGLCGYNQKRVCSILVDGNDIAVRALFKRCNLSKSIHEVLLVGLQSWRSIAHGKRDAGPQAVTWDMLCTVQSQNAEHESANDDLAALLKGLYVDMTRNNARIYAKELSEEIIEVQRAAEEAAIEPEVIEQDILEELSEDGALVIEESAMEELVAGIDNILTDEAEDLVFDDPLYNGSKLAERFLSTTPSLQPDNLDFDEMFNFDIDISDRAAA